jgi:hypothetical protein
MMVSVTRAHQTGAGRNQSSAPKACRGGERVRPKTVLGSQCIGNADERKPYTLQKGPVLHRFVSMT